MKICAAQIKAVKGDIAKNIFNHKKMIEAAVLKGADMIVFPELSITGYEPELAKELASNEDDKRFDEFQQISDAENIIICAGMPTRNDAGIMISMIIFQPHKPTQTYSKQHLHTDEDDYFINGTEQVFLTTKTNKIAFGICYETLVPEHAEYAAENGADIYIASVLNPVKNIERDINILSGVAKKYKMLVVMANYAGESGGYTSGGRTCAWNDDGIVLAELNNKDEGILIIDTDTRETLALQF